MWFSCRYHRLCCHILEEMLTDTEVIGIRFDLLSMGGFDFIHVCDRVYRVVSYSSAVVEPNSSVFWVITWNKFV